VTASLIFTILMEGMIVLIFGLLKKKPLRYLLFSGVLLNLITQPLLWAVLNIFFQHYLIALIITELFIWAFEGFLLFVLPCNQLSNKQAFSLSLVMNLASFGIGMLLPL
jgi:hypothetical protein